MGKRLQAAKVPENSALTACGRVFLPCDRDRWAYPPVLGQPGRGLGGAGKPESLFSGIVYAGGNASRPGLIALAMGVLPVSFYLH